MAQRETVGCRWANGFLLGSPGLKNNDEGGEGARTHEKRWGLEPGAPQIFCGP